MRKVSSSCTVRSSAQQPTLAAGVRYKRSSQALLQTRRNPGKFLKTSERVSANSRSTKKNTPNMRTASRQVTGRCSVSHRIYHILYKRKISKNEAKLEKAIRDVEASSKKVTDLMRAEQEFTQRVESAHTEISKLEQDLAEVDTLISRLRTELIKLGVSQEEVSIDGILESVELELLEKTSASTLFAQLADLQKQRSTLLSSFSKLSAELSTLNAQHTARKHALQQLQASKHSGDLTNTSRQLKERISSLEQEYQSAEGRIF